MSGGSDGGRGGPDPGSPWRAGLWYLIPLGLVAGFLLLAEHEAHVLGARLYALAGIALVASIVGLVARRRGKRGEP